MSDIGKGRVGLKRVEPSRMPGQREFTYCNDDICISRTQRFVCVEKNRAKIGLGCTWSLGNSERDVDSAVREEPKCLFVCP